MYLQIMSFDGPRTAAEVAASERAGRERITPLVEADTELKAGLHECYRCVGADGAEAIVVTARDQDVLDRLEHLVLTSELLPNEDPALLGRPSRVDRYAVTAVFGAAPRESTVR